MEVQYIAVAIQGEISQETSEIYNELPFETFLPGPCRVTNSTQRAFPQGFPVGGTLFIISLNDIFKVVKQKNANTLTSLLCFTRHHQLR